MSGNETSRVSEVPEFQEFQNKHNPETLKLWNI
jgi:hypothetical protein